MTTFFLSALLWIVCPQARPGTDAVRDAATESPVADAAAQESGAGGLGATIEAWWRYPLIPVGENWIKVGNLVAGLLLLVLGYFAARILSSLLRQVLVARIRMTEGGAAAIHSVVFYTLLLAFGFSALTFAGVPLTAFTLLGGAAAIGVGFGSQNIINNFISGLILLAERPINVGNLIQVGDLYGTVEHIGPRSTRVRTGDNLEIVVPNSSFLEGNVVNLTLSEARVRISVSVGVVYGSPTAEVRRLIEEAVNGHERVQKTPVPIVLFTEFGDNSLNFEVHFWIEMKRIMDRKIVESEIRCRIDELFRGAGIVIAFPQRDVHLDTVRPLEVRLQPAEDRS